MARARQTTLPGTTKAGETIQEITDAGLKYIDKRDQRMARGREEREAKVVLLDLMKERRLKHYRDPEADLTVDVESPSPKVIARIGGEKEEEEPE